MIDTSGKYIQLIAPILGAALVGAGSSLLGSLIASSSSSKQYSRTRDLMQLQHELNSPQQMKFDYEQAGFNPASMFGQGQSLGNTSLGSAPDEASAISAGSGLIQNAALLSSQIRNLDSQTQKNLSESELNAIQQEYQRIQTEYLPRLLSADLSLKEKDALLKEATSNLTKEQAKLVEQNFKNAIKEGERMDKDIALYAERIRQASSEADIAEMRKNMTPDLLEAELTKYFADINQAKAMATQLYAVAENVNKDTEVKEVQRQINEIVLSYTPSIQNELLNQEQIRSQTMGLERNRAAAGNKMAIRLAPFAEVMGSIGRFFSGQLTFSSGNGKQ